MMDHFIYLCVFAYILICSCVIQTEATCPHPDVPENGNFTSEGSKFELGDKITYSCKKGFALSGDETRKCMSEGMWSHHTPFCDPAIRLKIPTMESGKYSPTPYKHLIDASTSSCEEAMLTKDKCINVPLEKKMIIRTMKIFFKKGPIDIQIFTNLNAKKYSVCRTYERYLDSDQWVVYKCENNASIDAIQIGATQNRNINICEIEVYGKTEGECDQSPHKKLPIPNGHLQVSREKAEVICDDGFKVNGNKRILCEEGKTWKGGLLLCEEVLCSLLLSEEKPGVKWVFPKMSTKLSYGTTSRLTCISGYKKVGGNETIVCQKNGRWSKTDATCVEQIDSKERARRIILGVVGAAAIIIIIALLATIIYFIKKQKGKEVVVVYQPKSEESIISQPGGEYALPVYENLDNTAPEPPSTPRPFAKLSTMSATGDIMSTTWKSTYYNRHRNPNIPEIADDTMKPSTLYGS